MASIQTMINWMESRQGKVKYSMAARYGPNSFDCSSSVYNALIAGEFFPQGTMGNTDTLFGHLEQYGWKTTTRANAKRGDVFIWGKRGASGGSYGHTGIFVNNTNIIHCNSSANGISTNAYDSSLSGAGSPPATIYANPNADDTAPTLETDEEKAAWAIANILYGLGYNLIAISAILGNAEAESGMKPDRDQIGGAAYGILQWDGSAYPLVGTPTSNGRDYVRRLMNTAGITGDYTNAEPQARLIDWCMNNGQWIGVTSPTTVAAFKNATDLTQATTAFMDNFERPGVERLSERLAGAQKWYSFLQGVSLDSADEFETMTNVGELELLGISNGKVVAQGWHFSSDKDIQYIAFINAETDEELGRVKAEPVQRDDLAEEYPNVLGIETAGFDVTFEVENETAVYVKGIRTNTVSTDELIFEGIIVFERAFDPEVETFAATHDGFFIEILDGSKVVKRFNKILNELSWSNELFGLPQTELILPIEYREYFQSRAEVKIYVHQKVFHGLTMGVEENKQDETITVTLQHVVTEWTFRQVSTNLAAKSRTVNDIYSTLDFRYPNWNVEYLQDSAGRIIDYVYSRQDKLDGLTKTCELTDDLFWRVGFHAGRTLDIGTFGDKKPYFISTQPSNARNIRMISEPVIRHEYDNVINMATVYGEKSDSGMSSMSLREIYEEDGAQDPNFPVVILKNGINNERGYDYIEFTKLAPNNDIEYTVIDSESIALEGGTAIEGTFSFNDLAPFNIDSEEISEEDRAKAAKTAYDASVKKLKQSRRRYIVEVETERLPYDIDVGDRIRLVYDNSLLIQEECTNYQKKILSMDDWYYITAIEYNIDKNGTETNVITLEKELRTQREGSEE